MITTNLARSSKFVHLQTEFFLFQAKNLYKRYFTIAQTAGTSGQTLTTVETKYETIFNNNLTIFFSVI